MIEEITPTSIGYKFVRMKGNKRDGKCPRGKSIKCSACSNILLKGMNDLPSLWRCLSMRLDNVKLYTTHRNEDGDYMMSMVHKDSVLYARIQGESEVNGSVNELKDPEHKNMLKSTIAYTLTVLIDGEYPITLISE